MDPVSNPFAPGAGTPPPELAGRDDLREMVRVAIERVRRGLPTKSILMVGLRGVGKTVLLDRMRDDAEAAGIHTVRIEAPENRSLPALLAPQLRQALLRLSQNEQAKELAQRSLKGLAGFAKALKVKIFYRNGANIHGTRHPRRPSRTTTLNWRQKQPLPRWMKASSACGSTG